MTRKGLVCALLTSTLLMCNVQAAFAVATPSRVSYGGGNWFLLGANVPWFNYGRDFGGGNGNGGVSNPDVSAAVDAAFAQAQAAGITTIRWWLFEGGAPQVVRLADGTPTGLSPAIFPDIDAAVALAKAHGLYIQFCLFSSTTDIPRSWIDDPAQRTALASALAPLFAHYADQPHVMAWESFNEPEWQIWNNLIDQTGTVATSKAIAKAVHENSLAFSTVGQATVDGIPLWSGFSDLYTPHWYQGTMSSGSSCADCYASVNDLRTQKAISDAVPIIVGETDMGVGFGANTTIQDVLQDLYSKGFAGAYGWSLFPSHTEDHFALDLPHVSSFARSVSDIGPVGVAAPSCLSLSSAVAASTITVSVSPGGALMPNPPLGNLFGTVLGDVIFPNHRYLGVQDVSLTVPGYLRRRLAGITFPVDGCYSVQAAKLPIVGDFQGDNTIGIGDLVIGIRAFNGSSDSQAQLADKVFGGAVGLANIVTLIRNYNISPVGD